MSTAGVDALLWTAIATVAMVAAMLLLAAYRRRMHRAESAPRPVFTLAEIKRLRDTGGITIAEYEALRAKVLEHSRR